MPKPLLSIFRTRRAQLAALTLAHLLVDNAIVVDLMSLGGARPLWIRCPSAGCGGSIHRVWGRTPSDPSHCGGLVTASTHLTDSPRIADEPYV